MGAAAGSLEKCMTSKSSYMMVGGFILMLGAAFVWGVLWISAGGPPQRINRYIVYMPDSVSGLNVDAPVKFRGVDVGKVEQIEIDSSNPELIRLVLQVRENTPITADTVATLEYQGMTGIATVNFSGDQADSPPLTGTPGEDYPVITGQASVFSNLGLTLSDLLTNLTTTSESINAVLGEENRINVTRSLENVAVLTERFTHQADKLETVVTHLSVTLENTRNASADLPRLIDQFSQSAVAITAMADQISEIGENLIGASASIDRTVKTGGEDLLNFTSMTLPEISQMVNELRLASENLRRMSESLAQDPSVLLFGRSEPRPGPGE
jgi:phospholipid/cholesterol/gamma-HCH transport system substrate-binding protein